MRCGTTTRTRSGSGTGPPRGVTVRFRRLGRWSAGELVEPLGQRDIEVGETVAIVRRQGNVDAVVDVEPFRVMVQLLRRHRDPRHEAPGLAERLDIEGLLKGVGSFFSAPAGQLFRQAADGKSTSLNS